LRQAGAPVRGAVRQRGGVRAWQPTKYSRNAA
jgi:hypothetical protein